MRGVNMRDHAADAKVFKAFDDINRLQILEILRESEKCACVLLENLQISQSEMCVCGQRLRCLSE